MLGRMHMSVDDTIKAYVKLSKKVFADPASGAAADGRYKASNLEEAVREIVKEYAGDAEAGIMDPRSRDNICRTYASSALH